MTPLAVAGVTLATCFAAVLLRRERPEQAVAVSLLGGVAVFSAAMLALRPLLSEITSLMAAAGIASSYVGIVLRSLGICLLTTLAADTCRDAGETALAVRAETAGKVLLLGTALPLFRQLAELALTLMRGGA